MPYNIQKLNKCLTECFMNVLMVKIVNENSISKSRLGSIGVIVNGFDKLFYELNSQPFIFIKIYLYMLILYLRALLITARFQSQFP